MLQTVSLTSLQIGRVLAKVAGFRRPRQLLQHPKVWHIAGTRTEIRKTPLRPPGRMRLRLKVRESGIIPQRH